MATTPEPTRDSFAASQATAEVVREYGPFPGADRVNGVTFDGQHVWYASGDRLSSFEPSSGEPVRAIEVAAHAGTAFDGRYLYQLADDRIQKIEPQTGSVISTIPAPGQGRDSGMAWAEGTLWVGEYRSRKIHPRSARRRRCSPGTPGTPRGSPA